MASKGLVRMQLRNTFYLKSLITINLRNIFSVTFGVIKSSPYLWSFSSISRTSSIYKTEHIKPKV